MAKFFTSDTHFGHANIIKYSDRPFKDIYHMDAELVRRWNETVMPDDEVFHLGDVALGKWERWEEILTSLNGYKTLVIGNHDRVFAMEKQSMQDRFWPLYAEWFDIVVPDVTNFPLGDHMVNMSHFPYNGDSHDGDRFEEMRLEDRGSILLHGHTHLDQIVSYSDANTLQIHVGADAWDYTPVSEEQIISVIETAREDF